MLEVAVDNPEHFERIISPLRELDLNLKILFLTAGTQCLLKRFSETRRKHPLSRKGLPLADAIQQEQKLLTEIQVNADLLIDSSALNVHELRRSINDRFLASSASEMGVLVQSFGFKYGVPIDTDFVFDVRCLPNPHWEAGLKPLTGRDKAVAKYLEGYPEVDEMFDAILSFLTQWLPRFEMDNRSYMTISIGCTGGHHRSVYLTEKVAKTLKQEREQVSIRHRDLN